MLATPLPWIDLHCDSVLLCDAEFGKKYGYSPMGLRQNTGQLDLVRMKVSGCIAQFFALFLDKRMYTGLGTTALDEFRRLHGLLLSEFAKNSDLIRIATCHSEIMQNRDQGRLSALLAIEDGGVIDSVDRLKYVYDLGFRYITLVWNFATGLGHPGDPADPLDAADPSWESKGLTPLGRQIVAAMHDLRMLVDISHCNEKTGLDVFELGRRPVIASHSCCASVWQHKRNISDRLIRAVAESGGVIGVVYYPEFLQADAKAPAAFATIRQHVEHLRNMGGIECVALGSDFDGYAPVAGSQMAGVADVPLFGEYLLQSGYSVSDVEKIFSTNALRVIHEAL